MSASKLGGKLPPPESGLSGLDLIADELVRRPHGQHVVVLLVDCGEVKFEHAIADTLDIPPGVTASARIRRIEPLSGRDADLGRRLLLRAYERRTGQEELSGFDLEGERAE